MTVAGSLDSFSTERLRAERLTASHLPAVIRMNTERGRHGSPRRRSGRRLERRVYGAQPAPLGSTRVRPLDASRAGGREIIGRAVLRYLPVDGVEEIEVGYAFLPAYWGRGLATEVTATCLRLARNDCDCHKSSRSRPARECRVAARPDQERADLRPRRHARRTHLGVCFGGVGRRVFRHEECSLAFSRTSTATAGRSKRCSTTSRGRGRQRRSISATASGACWTRPGRPTS